MALAACGGGGSDTPPATATPPGVSSPTVARTWGTAELIKTDNAAGAGSPQIAFDASGNAIAVWRQHDGTRFNIWANRFSAASGTWGTAQLIETDNAGDAFFPQIAFDAGGNAIAVWEQSDGVRPSIWANRFSAASGTWGAAQLIENHGPDGAFQPQIAFDASGNAIAVWHQGVLATTRIWANRFSAASGTWGTAQLIENNGFNATAPQIAFDTSGNAIAVWEQSDGVRSSISANRFSAASGTWGTAQLIETDNAGDASAPQIAIDAGGNAIAVWQQSDGTRSNIWANRFSTASSTWGAAQLIETDNAGDASAPQIAIDAGGNAIAVWSQSDSTRSNIWASRFSAASGTWGAAQLIETDTGHASAPQIAIDAGGNAIVVWAQQNGPNIWANQFSAASGAWGAAQLIETNAGDASFPQIAVDANGNGIAVWEQFDGTRFNIWANRYR